MTTQTYPDIDGIIEDILDARTITDEAKAMLLDELRSEGMTGAAAAKVEALFRDELAMAERDMGDYLGMLPRLEAELTEAEREALPGMIENSIRFRAEIDALGNEERRAVDDLERAMDATLRTSSDEADASEADAIRTSLGLDR